MGKHKHYDLIMAWAEGQTIQYKTTNSAWMDWTPTDLSPNFNDPKRQFRIKPDSFADLKAAHAQGKTIQHEWIFGQMVNSRYIPEWRDDPNPKWIESVNYRIKPNKHQAMMDAYDAGGFLQCLITYASGKKEWRDWGYKVDNILHPSWDENIEYRIKPEVLVVERAVTIHSSDSGALYVLDWMGKSGHLQNVRYTFDSDTKELLNVEKI